MSSRLVPVVLCLLVSSELVGRGAFAPQILPSADTLYRSGGIEFPLSDTRVWGTSEHRPAREVRRAQARRSAG